MAPNRDISSSAHGNIGTVIEILEEAVKRTDFGTESYITTDFGSEIIFNFNQASHSISFWTVKHDCVFSLFNKMVDVLGPMPLETTED